MLELLAQASPSRWEVVIDNLARTPLSQVVWFVAICTVLRLGLHPLIVRTDPHRRRFGFALARFLNEALDAIVYAAVVVFLVIRPFGIQAFRIPSESMLDTLLVNDFIVANKAVYRYTDPKAGDIVVFRPPVRACKPEQIDPDGQPSVDFIKRCIGVPGDVIEIRAGTLYRNGKPVTEPYRKTPNDYDFKIVRYEGERADWKGDYIPVMFGFSGLPNYQVNGLAKEFAVGAGVDEHAMFANEPYATRWKTESELTPEDRRTITELSNLPPAPIPPGHYLMMGDNRGGSFDGRGWGLVRREDIIGRSEFIWLPIGRWGSTR